MSSRVGVYVPTGIAAFPQEIVHVPRVWAKDVYKNIVSYTYMPRGGHFAAFEEPKLLAQDIIQFVQKVEQLWACSWNACIELKQVILPVAEPLDWICLIPQNNHI